MTEQNNTTSQPQDSQLTPIDHEARAYKTKAIAGNECWHQRITLNRVVMPRDRYSGEIYLTLKDRSDRLF
jgi:hypothetical protein